VLAKPPKLVTIDEKADYQVGHGRRCGKTNATTYETLDPCPQIARLPLDFLRMLLANLMLLWSDVPFVSAPSIGGKPCVTKRLQQVLSWRYRPREHDAVISGKLPPATHQAPKPSDTVGEPLAMRRGRSFVRKLL
jgi:hypothetical protein